MKINSKTRYNNDCIDSFDDILRNKMYVIDLDDETIIGAVVNKYNAHQHIEVSFPVRVQAHNGPRPVDRITCRTQTIRFSDINRIKLATKEEVEYCIKSVKNSPSEFRRQALTLMTYILGGME